VVLGVRVDPGGGNRDRRTYGGWWRGGGAARAPPPRGALAGVVFAALCTLAAWFAAIVLPLFAGTIGASVRLGTDPRTTGFIAVLWGVAGGTAGSLVPHRDGDRSSPTQGRTTSVPRS
jgi:hypothetical protein